MPPPDTAPPGPDDAAAAHRADDNRLVAALREGDEGVFLALVEHHHAALVHIAMAYVPSRAIAEEVAQDAWIGLLKGLDRFEGRSSVKTWLFRILINLAKARGERERRTIPFSSMEKGAPGNDPAVSPSRFLPADDEWPGHWAAPPRPWDTPEDRLLAGEVLTVLDAAIVALPGAQREVIRLRDVEGWSAAEVCAALQITDANQRVLLHRGRSRLRAALETYLDPDL